MGGGEDAGRTGGAQGGGAEPGKRRTKLGVRHGKIKGVGQQQPVAGVRVGRGAVSRGICAPKGHLRGDGEQQTGSGPSRPSAWSSRPPAAVPGKKGALLKSPVPPHFPVSAPPFPCLCSLLSTQKLEVGGLSPRGHLPLFPGHYNSLTQRSGPLPGSLSPLGTCPLEEDPCPLEVPQGLGFTHCRGRREAIPDLVPRVCHGPRSHNAHTVKPAGDFSRLLL